MKTSNKVKAIPAAIQTELVIESVTIDASVLIHEYDLACYAMDDANLAQYNATKGMHGIIEKLARAGFKTLQSGHNKKKKTKEGEFPYTVAASEFEVNYLGRHLAQWNDEQKNLPVTERTEYVTPSKANIDNIVKQKIASLSFLLDYGKYTSNVGKDKPRLIAEVLNENWLALLQDKKSAEASALRAAGIAAESKKRASEIQAAVKLAQSTPTTPAAVVETVVSKSNDAIDKADKDAIAAQAAQNLLDDIAAEVAEVEEQKSLAEQVAAIKKTKGKGKSTTAAPSVATAKTGEVDHDTATVISKDASIGRDSALRVKKAIAAIVDHMSLIEVREVYRALGLVLLDAKMDM
jgi:hypothetical protein